MARAQLMLILVLFVLTSAGSTARSAPHLGAASLPRSASAEAALPDIAKLQAEIARLRSELASLKEATETVPGEKLPIAALGALGAVIAAFVGAAASLLTTWLQGRKERELSLEKRQLELRKLDQERVQIRGESYGSIWTYTGALNLHGPTRGINSEELSRQLKDWYFKHGWILSSKALPYYFLVQEVLNFALLNSLSFERPDAKELYGSKQRPTDVLQGIRCKLLRIKAKDKNKKDEQNKYTADELSCAVVCWKENFQGEDGYSANIKAWVMFQIVLSSFRSQIVDDLGSREAFNDTASPKERKSATFQAGT